MAIIPQHTTASSERTFKFVNNFEATSSVDLTPEDRLQSNTASTEPIRCDNAPATVIMAGSHHSASNKISTTPNVNASATPYSPAPPLHKNLTETMQVAIERERVRAEFYATYDVMTGVRIAATLGGFFGLMVFLIVWKSRSSSNETLKVLKDPKMAAVAAVCMQEEEERELQEAIVATGMTIYPEDYRDILYRRQRMLSLGNVSAPPLLNRVNRFSSIGGGGYNSLLVPPRRFSYSALSTSGGSLRDVPSSGIGRGMRRRSGSDSSRIYNNYPLGGNFGANDYFAETEDELENEEYIQRKQDFCEMDELDVYKPTIPTKKNEGFLTIPTLYNDARRSSAMTCCSTDSSYLERRCSAYTLGLSNITPKLLQNLSATSRSSSIQDWDYYYPDIHVGQPTSSCPSNHSICGDLKLSTPKLSINQTAKMRSRDAVKSFEDNKIGTVADLSSPVFVRKHSIVSYDPESAQAGRKQQIHSISADTVDVYPYNQHMIYANVDLFRGLSKPIESALTSNVLKVLPHTNSVTEELHLSVQRKVALVELGNKSQIEPVIRLNGQVPKSVVASESTGLLSSSSISVDSTHISLEKLKGSSSMGTTSTNPLFNIERRAPLASLSSFQMSSLEYQDSDMRSFVEDSSCLESAADTDEDLQELDSDSEEINSGNHTSLAAAVVHHERAYSHKSTLLSTPISTKAAPQGDHSAVSLANTSICIQQHLPQRNGTLPQLSSLQYHRVPYALSCDCISLIGQQVQEFQFSKSMSQAYVPVETHFGAFICTSSLRRAQLLQQYSDPQSLPTTTTTTDGMYFPVESDFVCQRVTTTSDDMFCSTYNTEEDLAKDAAYILHDTDIEGEDIHGVVNSPSYTQYSSKDRSSQQTGNYLKCSKALIPGVPIISPSPFLLLPNNRSENNQKKSHQHLQPSLQLQVADDPCPSSISDSIINTRQATICMPASLKCLILRGSNGQEKSAIYESVIKFSSEPETYGTDINKAIAECVSPDLPFNKLQTDESSVTASVSCEDVEITKSCQSIDYTRSLPSRKWSKETLF